MPKQVTTAASNRYCQARLRAAKYNPEFLTRATAINQLPGVTEDSLKKYELDITRAPNIVVALMADAYNEPELRYWYCANECPLGKDCRVIPEMPPERALLRLKNAITEIDDAMHTLAQIMDDGMVDENEKPLIPRLREQFLEARRRVDENLATLERAEKTGIFE
jgi:hypothetical protein